MSKLSRYLILMIGLMVLGSCSKDDTDPTSNDQIQTESPIEIGSTTISVQGGLIEIDDIGGPLEGMTINVPANSYSHDVSFNVAYERIISHELGEDFEPISPLVTIENGGFFADRILTIKFPISINPNEHVMAFYVDKRTGNLDPISTLKREDEYIEIGLRHFSSVAILKTLKSKILSKGDFTTGFGVNANGFSFPNEGTYPTPLGLCAGMSIAAQYYYNENINTNIYRYYDNNQLHVPTPAWWQDDIRGLKLTSWLQQAADACYANNYTEIEKIESDEPLNQFWNLIHSMYNDKKTQLIGLKTDQYPEYGHLVLMTGYRVEGDRVSLEIYDPNNKGERKELVFDMSTEQFEVYESAINAEALRDGYKIDYDRFSLLPTDLIMNPIDLTYAHNSVLNGTIGQALFPAYEVFAVPKDGKFEELKLDLRHDFTSQNLPFDEFDFEVRGIDASIDLRLETVIWSKHGFERTKPATTIKLTSNDTLIGLWLKAIPSNVKYEKWYNFNWFQIKKQNFWIEPADTTIAPNAEVKFKLRNNGSIPKNARLEWDFGDRNYKTTSDTAVLYTFEEPGTFVVTCVVHDENANKVLAEVKTDITVSLYPKIEITLSGQHAGGSTIKLSDNFGNVIDLPFYTWSNKISTTDLTWNDNAFEVEFTINRSGRTYTYRISGTMNKDFTQIEYMTAIVTGVGEAGYAFNSAIIIEAFPVSDIVKGESIGMTLNGSAAEAKVTQFNYLEKSEVGGSDYTWQLQSIDWSNNNTQLFISIEK